MEWSFYEVFCQHPSTVLNFHTFTNFATWITSLHYTLILFFNLVLYGPTYIAILFDSIQAFPELQWLWLSLLVSVIVTIGIVARTACIFKYIVWCLGSPSRWLIAVSLFMIFCIMSTALLRYGDYLDGSSQLHSLLHVHFFFPIFFWTFCTAQSWPIFSSLLRVASFSLS